MPDAGQAPEAPGTAAEPDAGPAGREATTPDDPEAPTSVRPESAGPEYGPTDRGRTPQDAPEAGPEAGSRAFAAAPEAPGAEYVRTDRERPPHGTPEPPEPSGVVQAAPTAEPGTSGAAPEGPGPGNGPQEHVSPSPGALEPVHAAQAAAPQGGPGPSVTGGAPQDAGDGVFKVRLANFEGPFDLLLQLISRHKMDVTEVALSKVTDEFMAHIRAMGPDWDLDETTEFLVVAATLLDLKAARLLPAAEVEDEADLALLEARDLLFARLLQYRAYKQIAEIFNGRLEAEARRYPRTVGLEPHHAELLPEVVISIGPEGFARLAVKAMQPKPKPQVYVEHIHAPLVSVQEQAQIVVARLRELGEASFRVLVDDTEDTLTVVARFLALLELYREKAVALDQETALGDLLVRWTGGDGDAEPVVTDEFDREPEENEKTEEEQQA
ncbi:segregation/condensation protein A [Streptomyces sp. SCL15-6]|uniref:segregation and condensation protein A n=1 Tax=Streptomyces sp. SCL15-6 TaxID=2967222 RepID=UPI0039902EAA